MASYRPDHGAEVEEAREVLLEDAVGEEQPELARRRWPQLAALAVFAASAALLCLSRGGPGRAGSSPVHAVRLATVEDETDSSNLDGSYCPMSGDNCTALRCCAEPGFQCYKKNSEWASCQANCTKNKTMPGDTGNGTWDCEEFGARTPEAREVDWITGAARDEDCRSKTFCTGMDDHCYLKNKAWGMCMPECDRIGWTCEQLY